MQHKTVAKILLPSGIIAIAWILAGCSNLGTINTEPKAGVDRLSSSFGVLERLGETPVKIIEEGAVARYEFRRPGAQAEYLLVMYPQEVKGSLLLKLLEGKSRGRVFDSYTEYVDTVMRCHRHLVRGEIKKAQELIAETNKVYGVTFATAYLAGVISLVDGRIDDAGKELRFAKALFPEAKELAELIP
jgi:hypothetical protein